jgi:hypothetical protein
MTQQEILEYNKRCAEFLGAKNLGKLGLTEDDYYEHELFERAEWSNRFQDNIEISTMIPPRMKFHSDWNWIMAIVEAIENIDRNDEHGLFRLIRYGSSCNWNNLPPSINADTPKEATVQAINQFLIWYNENKTNNLI